MPLHQQVERLKIAGLGSADQHLVVVGFGWGGQIPRGPVRTFQFKIADLRESRRVRAVRRLQRRRRRHGWRSAATAEHQTSWPRSGRHPRYGSRVILCSTAGFATVRGRFPRSTCSASSSVSRRTTSTERSE